MKIVLAYAIASAGLVILAVVGTERPFALVVYALALAVVAGVAAAFSGARRRTLRAMISRVKDAAPVVATGLIAAPPNQIARLLAEVRTLGFEVVGATDTTIAGAPPTRTWILTSEPGTTWVEVGMGASPMAIFLSQGADRRFLETTSSAGETIDVPSLLATPVSGDPSTVLAAHRRLLAEWETRDGPARVVRTLDDYLAAERDQRQLTAGLRIAAFIERVLDPGIRHWALACVIACVAIAALWGLDIARR